MVKKYKYLLIFALTLFLCGGGAFYYFLHLKTYHVADKKVDKILKSEYKIELPDDNSQPSVQTNKPNDSGGASVPSTQTNDNHHSSILTTQATSSTSSYGNSPRTSGKGISRSTDLSKTKKDSMKGDSGTSSSNSINNGKQTSPQVVNAEIIKQKYRPTFESLESQANAKIDSLVARAASEYEEKKANGESISFLYFYQKYSSSGKELENQTDAAFQYIYQAVKNDLKKHGYSTSNAKSFKEEYENGKKARETALIDKAKSAL